MELNGWKTRKIKRDTFTLTKYGVNMGLCLICIPLDW